MWENVTQGRRGQTWLHPQHERTSRPLAFLNGPVLLGQQGSEVPAPHGVPGLVLSKRFAIDKPGVC